MSDPRPKLNRSITFERGLNEHFEESMLPDGALSVLRNWEASPTGELRARAGWSKGSTTSAPATCKGVGIGYFSRGIYPGIVQTGEVFTGTTGTTLSPAWRVATTKGNLLCLVVQVSPTAGTNSDISTPTGWTLAKNQDGSPTNGEPEVSIFHKANAVSETGIVSVTLTNPQATTAQLLEVSGIVGTSPLDVTQGNNNGGAGSTTPTTGSTAATAQAVEFVLGALALQSVQTVTAVTAGYTLLNETRIDATRDLTANVFYRVTNATGAQTLSATSTSSQYSGAIVTFKGWSAGTPSAGQTSIEEMIVAQNDTTEYDIFSISRSNLSAGTWANEGSIAVTDPTQAVAMSPGLGRLWLNNRQFSSIYMYDGLTVSAISPSPAGRGIAVHKNRVWSAGNDGTPGRLNFSNINDGFSWPAINFIDVAAEEGEPIEDITPQEDSLVIGKRTGLWVLTGSGLDTFVLRKLAVGGIAPGRTLTPTPYGTVAAGRAAIWLINGTEVTKLSLPISETFAYSTGFLTGSFVNDSYYLCDYSNGNVYALNMQTGTWREERLGSAATEGPAVLYNHDMTQFFAPKAATVGGLLNYREFPTTSRTKDFDTLTETFAAYPLLLFPVGPEELFTPRKLYLRIRQHGGNASQAGIDVTPRYRLQSGTSVAGTVHTIDPKPTAAVFRERIDLGNQAGVSGVRFDFDQILGTTDDTTMDIEEATFEFDVEQIR